MKYSKIIGTGSYLPDTILTNADLEKIVDTSDEWIFQRVGIRERHIVGDSDETVSTMTVKAARKALENTQLQPNDIDLIIACTATNDYLFPSAACIVQKELGIDKRLPAFDLNAACAGFIYGLSVADQFIKGGSARNALVIGVDALLENSGLERPQHLRIIWRWRWSCDPAGRRQSLGFWRRISMRRGVIPRRYPAKNLFMGYGFRRVYPHERQYRI